MDANDIYRQKYEGEVRRIHQSGNPGAWVAWAHYRRLAQAEADAEVTEAEVQNEESPTSGGG